jgi:polar amino acid transport system substrate-binding protein
MARRTARSIVGFAILLLALGLTACNSTGGFGAMGSSSSTPTMDRITSSGKLRVGVTGKQPPFNMTSKSGEIIGLEADLARALALSMDVEVEFVTKDFADLLDAVESGDIDLALSGLTMTPERNRRLAFAGPYFISGKGLITTSATLAKTDSAEDLMGQGIKLAALADSTSLVFVEKSVEGATAVPVRDYDEGIQKVISGEVHAMVADFPICLVALFQHPDAGLESAISPFTFEPLGAALPANDALFLNLVQNYMSMLEQSGLMSALRSKWFEDGSWLAELEDSSF